MRATARRRVARDHPAGIEHADAAAKRERLRHVVGDEDHGRAELLLDAGELAADLRARDRIERAERFVHQQDRRIDRQRAREADALPLSA